MSREAQSIAFNAVPLLALAAVYLLVTISLAPTVWRSRARTQLMDVALLLTFPALAVMAAIWGVAVIVEREPIVSHVWASFVGIVVVLVPALLFAVRRRETVIAATGALRAREAEEQRSLRDRELEVASRLANALTRTHDAESVARVLLDDMLDLFHLDFAALSLLSDDGRSAYGVLARSAGADVDWWREVEIDLELESSGIASAAFEAAPLAVYDVRVSGRVSRRLAERVNAKSAAYVPLLAHGRVIAVISLATTGDLRAFTADELALMQALASDAATALDRARSAAALEQALERERLVASISRKLRSELDLDAVLDVAVSETARALGACRALIGLGEADNPSLPLAAEWRAAGLEPVGAIAEGTPVSKLALSERRTVAAVDTAADEAAEPFGDWEILHGLGSRAVLATPIVVLDSVIGVFALHRAEPLPWTEADVALAEAVAFEAGLAIHVARLLGESRGQVRRQGSLLRAAQVLSGDLELEGVLRRLTDELCDLLQADTADCYLYDDSHRVLRCAAVRGLPDELIGLELPLGAGLGAAAVREGRAVIAAPGDELRQSGANAAYRDLGEVMVAPMRWGDETTGLLGVGLRGDERRFRQTDADVLEAFAGLASLALQNAETFSRSASQARAQRGFYRIAAVLGQSLSRSATLDAVAQAAAEALGGSFAAVLVPAGSRLSLGGAYELPAAVRELVADGLQEHDAIARAAADRRILAATDVAQDDRFDSQWQEHAGAGSYTALLSIPFDTARAPGLVAVLFVEQKSFSDDDLELARHLANAARGALERSELFEAERTARALAQQLARTGSVLATELDPAAILDEVVDQAPALLGTEACAIRLLEGDQLVVSAACGQGAVDGLGSRSSASAGLSGDVVQSRSPVAIVDSGESRRFPEDDPLLVAGYCSYLGVPLVGPEGALHGVLAVYGRRPREWREEEVDALQALAANTSAALSNAELYQRVALEKERSFAILANIADGIVAVDREGHVVLWNAAAEQITGVPAIDALGRTTVQVLHRALESEGDEPVRDRPPVAIQRNGDVVWLSLTEAVMRDPAGAVAGRIFAFRDISADHLVEQLKSNFVSTVSHELRTPLTSIYGFAETMLRSDVMFGEDERRTFLGYIASESRRLTAIVDALLNAARLDTGDVQVRLGPTDVGEVVESAVAQIRNGDGHRFVVDLPDQPVEAEADRDKLRQVFAILLDNAVKYSPEGGTVTVAAKLNGDRVELCVSDEGPGIPQIERKRIFRKFYRVTEHGTAGSTESGTGLGLYIAHGLVSAMGGQIDADSAEGGGSTFRVELPLAHGRGGRG
ncbi:MAG TPA: GAF domain-containing protein [Gaiellaceae bacterium]